MVSVEKLQNNRKLKKKYQKFNIRQGGDNFVSFENFESMSSAWKRENDGKTNGLIDFKDFPELKVVQKNYKKSCYEIDSREMKSVSPWMPINVENKNQISESFPPLSVTKNHKTSERNFLQENESSTKINLESSSLGLTRTKLIVQEEVEVKKEVCTNVNTSRDSQPKTKIFNSLPQNQKNPNKKKRSDPVFITFQDILVNKTKKRSKQQNISRIKVQRFQQELLSGNFLDSSNPVRSRGKHREIKKKKLTSLKRAIIGERILKQKMRKIADSSLENEYVNALVKMDFNAEMKSYLLELNNRKLKNSKIDKKEIKNNVELENSSEKEENIGAKLIEKKEESSEKFGDFSGKEIPQITSETEIKFSSKFREKCQIYRHKPSKKISYAFAFIDLKYCDNMVTPNLNYAVSELIKVLVKLQDNQFLRDPIKAKMRKRHVSGIREVKKYLNLEKVKMVIIAPNLEKLQMEGGVYDLVNELKSMAKSKNVPYGFALNRYKLGICTKKNAPVSAFAVLNYEGAETLYKNALQQLNEAKNKFSELARPGRFTEKPEDVNSKLISSLISAFHEDLKIRSKVESD